MRANALITRVLLESGGVSRYVYHFAPSSARSSIASAGIDRERGVPWQERVRGAKRGALSLKNAPEEHVPGNYVWHEKALRMALGALKKGDDVWQVDTSGVEHQFEPHHSVGWVFRSQHPIPVNRVRRLSKDEARQWV